MKIWVTTLFPIKISRASEKKLDTDITKYSYSRIITYLQHHASHASVKYYINQ